MDQANALRGRVRLKQKETESFNNINLQKQKNARVISIASGKGGVGKSNIAINLAINIKKRGKSVVVIDADLGLSNIEILLGISPKYTLYDIISGEKNIEEVITDGPLGVKIISGGSGLAKLANITSAQLSSIISNFAYLDNVFDYIIIDTGSGLSDTVISLICAAQSIIIVTTPEPTAITDAYAVIKATSKNLESYSDVSFKIIVNKVENEKEGMNVFEKISVVSERFLKTKIISLGYIPEDTNLIKAVKSQEPVALSYPNSDASDAIMKIGSRIMDIEDRKQSFGILSFVKKLISIFND